MTLAQARLLKDAIDLLAEIDTLVFLINGQPLLPEDYRKKVAVILARFTEVKDNG